MSYPAAPTDKKEYISQIGKILVGRYGKKEFYLSSEVISAHTHSASTEQPEEIASWAMSVFCSHEDFDRHHADSEEKLDYSLMKREMLKGMTDQKKESWFDLNSLEVSSLVLDASWLEIGESLEPVFEGIGEVVSGILEGF